MSLMQLLSPQNDIAFKKIFGAEKNKDILIHFLNDVIERPNKQCITDITFLNPIQYPKRGIGKQSIVDVLCKEENGTQYIVEMQVANVSGFEKRAQAYSIQAKKGGSYKDLKEVIFLAIVDFDMFPNKKDYKSVHVTLDQKTYERDLKDFSFTFIELKKFNKTIDELETYEDKWCYFFKHAHKPESMHKLIADDNDVITKAYHELSMQNWTQEEFSRYEAYEKITMDNLARDDYIEQHARETGLKEGLRKGREEGREEGLEEGLEEGVKKGREEGEQSRNIQIAKNLLSHGMPNEIIAQATGLSIYEISKLLPVEV